MNFKLKKTWKERTNKQLFSRGYLRCHEYWRPFLCRCTLCLDGIFRCAKVGKFRTHSVQLGGKRDDEQVVRLQVAVEELVGVKVCHSACAVAADEQLEPFRQLALAEQALHGAEFAKLYHECVQRAADASELDDVVVSEFGIVLCFRVVRWQEIVIFFHGNR